MKAEVTLKRGEDLPVYNEERERIGTVLEYHVENDGWGGSAIVATIELDGVLEPDGDGK